MKQYIKNHGTSYYLANLLFPRTIQKAIIELYAYVRVPDDIVDDIILPYDQKKQQCLDLYQQYQTQTYTDPQRQEICEANIVLQQTYKIPTTLYDDFWTAMLQDVDVHHYQTYQQLQWYMYGSAEVVWLILCYIIGYDQSKKTETITAAKKLGEAMQYSNFLRDIHEDYRDLWRIYMPQDRLKKAGLTHDHITQYIYGKPIDDVWKNFMKQEISHTRILYQQANQGIKYLNPQGRSAVLLASKMYEGILDRIIKNDYDVFSQSARTRWYDKAMIILRYLFSR